MLAQENGSDVIEVYSRLEFRRWRYAMDIVAGGSTIFTDAGFKKMKRFGGAQ